MSDARERFSDEQPEEALPNDAEELQPAESHSAGRSLILSGEIINNLSEERLTSVIRALGLLLGGEIRAQVSELGRIRNAGEHFTAEDAAALGWTQDEWVRYLSGWSRRPRNS